MRTTHSALETLSSVFKFRLLGMGLLWAWIYCCWFTNALFPEGAGIGVNVDSSWYISSLTVAITLTVTPFCLRQRELRTYRWAHAAQLVFICMGTFLMADAQLTHIDSEFLSFSGAALTGVGAGWLWIMWGELYAKLDDDVAETAAPASAIAVPAALFVVENLHGITAVIAVVLIPCISYILLMLAFSEQVTHKVAGHHFTPTRIAFWTGFLRVGGGAILVHAVIAIIWVFIPPDFVLSSSNWLMLSFFVGAIAAVGVSMASVLFSARPGGVLATYRWVLPVLVTALTLFSLKTYANQLIASGLIMLVMLGYNINLWIYFSRIAHAGWKSPAICLGLSRGFSQVGVVLGNTVGLYAFKMVSEEVLTFEHVCLALICFSVIAVALFLSREPSFGIQYESLSPATNLSFKGDLQASIRYPEMRVNKLNACELLAEKGNLSHRELEVLTLLAQGRNLPYIRDALYISKNTASTHIRKIYRKLDVHSRQELLDLVESHEDTLTS